MKHRELLGVIVVMFWFAATVVTLISAIVYVVSRI